MVLDMDDTDLLSRFCMLVRPELRVEELGVDGLRERGLRTGDGDRT
jgi:hypothetical protein